VNTLIFCQTTELIWKLFWNPYPTSLPSVPDSHTYPDLVENVNFI